jgi:hypothetical protein
MTAKYHIFKKTPENEFIWVEAVEDIVAAKKRTSGATSHGCLSICGLRIGRLRIGALSAF